MRVRLRLTSGGLELDGDVVEVGELTVDRRVIEPVDDGDVGVGTLGRAVGSAEHSELDGREHGTPWSLPWLAHTA